MVKPSKILQVLRYFQTVEPPGDNATDVSTGGTSRSQGSSATCTAEPFSSFQLGIDVACSMSESWSRTAEGESADGFGARSDNPVSAYERMKTYGRFGLPSTTPETSSVIQSFINDAESAVPGLGDQLSGLNHDNIKSYIDGYMYVINHGCTEHSTESGGVTATPPEGEDDQSLADGE